MRKEPTAGAKARTHFQRVTARVNSCPSRNLPESEFFRSLLVDFTLVGGTTIDFSDITYMDMLSFLGGSYAITGH